MGRFASFNTTIEDSLTFRLKSLTENKIGFLSSYGHRTGVTSWSTNGITTSSISLEVYYSEEESYIIFDYKYRDNPIKYKVDLVYKTSNLGKGKVWFMVCPSTGKLCRKLHLINGYFLHRTADPSLMYANQMESKKNRALLKVFNRVFLSDEVYNERYKKYFKTHYKGIPTKRFLKLQNKINIADSYPAGTLETLLMK